MRSSSDRYRGEYRLTARAMGVITGGKCSTRPPDLILRPLRQRLPVCRLIPTMRHARSDGTPSEISLANASRLA